jgi:SepF-like predicted cell division protein (DUF552 family)
MVRKKQMHFLVNEFEEELIKQKMEEGGFKNLGAYMRKMAIDGYTIKLDLSDMKEAIRLLRISSNNLNQYAKKANETGHIYAEDIKDLKTRQDELWKVLKEILSKLSGM